MPEDYLCFRCGTSLVSLTLPFSRRDACPQCAIDVHVCRMCLHFDTSKPKQCREDDAEEVFEKEKSNFCEWFSPSRGAFDETRVRLAEKAKSELSKLFDGPQGVTDTVDSSVPEQRVEDLFK